MPKHLENFELGVDRMFLVILCMADTMCSAADTMHGAADIMCGAANMMHVRYGWLV